MNRVIFLTAEDARLGFSLAGMQQLPIERRQAEATLRRVIEDKDVAVVVIDERLVREIPEQDFVELENSWQGVIVTLPAPIRIEGEAEDRLQRLIRRALGYHVRLEL